MTITAEEVLAEIGPVQEILDEHDGVVTETSCSHWMGVAMGAPQPQ
jgi:hypothetical protein